jgi:hypothetical protein
MSKRNSAMTGASSLIIIVEEAYDLKMLGRGKQHLSRIYYASLTEVLQEKDLPVIDKVKTFG